MIIVQKTTKAYYSFTERLKMNKLVIELTEKAKQDNVSKLSVGAALIHNKQLLILKRMPTDFMPNIYELPGGALESGENLIQALERELEEETNCKIDKIVKYIDYIDFPSSTGKLTRRFNFLVYPKTPVSIILSEHSGYKWILPEEAPNYNITEQTQKIIALTRRALENHNSL